MSYARGKSRRIEVGHRAAQDVILAQASLDAAETLRHMMAQPPASRMKFLRERTLEYGPGAFDRVMRRAEAAKGTREDDQALFDALRLVIANYYASRGVEMVHAAMAQRYGADQGLGKAPWKKIGCFATGLVTAGGGAIVGAYTGGAGAGVVGAGGTIVADTMGCNKGAQEAAQRIAAAQAAQAQAEANTAAALAAREAAQSAEKTKRLRTALMVGGGALALITMGLMIVKM